MLNLTLEYHLYNQFADEYRQKEMESCALRKKVKMSTKVSSNNIAYEKQTGANCYGCAGAMIINHLTKTNLFL